MVGYVLRVFSCASLLIICFTFGVASDDYMIAVERMNLTRHSNRYLGEYKPSFWSDENGVSMVTVLFEVTEIARKATGIINVNIGTTEKTRVNMISLNVDLCKFLAGDYNNQVFKRIYQQATRNQGLPKKCPVKPSKYSLMNFTVQPRLFPPVVRQLSWELDLSVIADDIPVCTVFVYGKVKKVGSQNR